MFDEFLSLLRIVDDRFDFAAVAEKTFVLEQTVAVALGEMSYSVEIEIMKRCAKILSFGEDGAPTESGLKTLQAQFLEQAMIITYWETPFGIVIAEKVWRRIGPSTA